MNRAWLGPLLNDALLRVSSIVSDILCHPVLRYRARLGYESWLFDFSPAVRRTVFWEGGREGEREELIEFV